jgi:hypothetical protein
MLVEQTDGHEGTLTLLAGLKIQLCNQYFFSRMKASNPIILLGLRFFSFLFKKGYNHEIQIQEVQANCEIKVITNVK